MGRSGGSARCPCDWRCAGLAAVPQPARPALDDGLLWQQCPGVPMPPTLPNRQISGGVPMLGDGPVWRQCPSALMLGGSWSGGSGPIGQAGGCPYSAMRRSGASALCPYPQRWAGLAAAPQPAGPGGSAPVSLCCLCSAMGRSGGSAPTGNSRGVSLCSAMGGLGSSGPLFHCCAVLCKIDNILA